MFSVYKYIKEDISFLLQHKLLAVGGTLVCLLVGIRSYYNVYKTKCRLQEELQRKQFFYKTHHACVVMYRTEERIIGWSETHALESKEISQTIENMLKPLSYFLSTAERSLDIAQMIISIGSFHSLIVSAVERGVLVRIIVDGGKADLRMLRSLFKNTGVQLRCVRFLSLNSKVESMFHLKCVLKDVYCEGQIPSLCFGSMNWTMSGICAQYENVQFTCDEKVVKTMAKFFEFAWNNSHAVFCMD